MSQVRTFENGAWKPSGVTGQDESDPAKLHDEFVSEVHRQILRMEARKQRESSSVRRGRKDRLEVAPLDQVKNASVLSEFAYLSPDTISAKSDTLSIFSLLWPGFPLVVEGSNPSDAQAWLWSQKGSRELYVAFRGSSDADHIRAALQDRGDKVCPINETLLCDFCNLSERLQSCIGLHLPNVDTLIFTGHALGGGLATIAAPFFACKNQGKSVRCITFGAPPVGDNEFRQWFTKSGTSMTRILDSRDPIPFLRNPYGTYVHISKGLCLSRGGGCTQASRNGKPTPAIWLAMNSVDIRSISWEQGARKYKRRVQSFVAQRMSGSEYQPMMKEKGGRPSRPVSARAGG